MLENDGKRKIFEEKSQELIFSPGSCSKLANKSQGDLEPPELLLSTEEAGGNAGDSSEHLKPRLLLSERDVTWARPSTGRRPHRSSTRRRAKWAGI